MSRRQDVLWAYLERWQRETSVSWGTIATVVRETYHHMVPGHARVVQFSTHKDAYQRSRLDAQVLRRARDQDEGFPMDLEDACVLALPERYQQDCANELAARIGQHSAPITEEETSAFESLANVSRDFAAVVDALSPALADGRFTPADRAYAAQIEKSIAAMQGQLCGVLTELRSKVINHNVRALRPAESPNGDPNAV